MTDEVVVDTDVLSRVRLRTEPDPSYARYVRSSRVRVS